MKNMEHTGLSHTVYRSDFTLGPSLYAAYLVSFFVGQLGVALCFTSRLSALALPIVNVVLNSAQFKMCDVYASWGVTDVHDEHPTGDGAVVNYPRGTVSRHQLIFDRKPPIAISLIHTGGPYQAVANTFSFIKEPFHSASYHQVRA